ncbi:MAG: cytochrome P450 [Betaproteobacteria bacterium]|nr:cytochrome P450 [Betaproteobacteria bacterium]
MDPRTSRTLARDFQLTRVPPGFIDDPYPYYAALREHDPVHELEGGGVFLSRYDDVLAVYRDPRASSDKKAEFKPKFGDSPLYGHHTTSLVFNDPPLHTRVRRLLLGALNQRAIVRMEADVVRLVDQLLDRMAEKSAGNGRLDFIDEFAAQIPIEVIGNLLEVPRDEREPLRDWSLAILSGLEPAPSAEILARGNRAVSDFLAYLRGLVVERRKMPGDFESDVLTRLIQGEKNGERLSESELLHNCIFMLNAGHETTTNLIGNGAWLLLTHAHEFARLRANPLLVSAAVEEMLRYEGSIQLNNRRLTAPMKIGGKLLPAGTFITIGIGAANRDPAQFPHAERFDVSRKPNRHLAFGQGDHACAGMNVARLEARIAIGRLVARFPRLELAGQPERDLRVRFRGFRHLPVRT